jgi:hypothetical protein
VYIRAAAAQIPRVAAAQIPRVERGDIRAEVGHSLLVGPVQSLVDPGDIRVEVDPADNPGDNPADPVRIPADTGRIRVEGRRTLREEDPGHIREEVDLMGMTIVQ